MPHRGVSGPPSGLVTGHVFKLVRESIPRSQEALAVDLGVDRTTIQSWESGRRPFTSVALSQVMAVRNTLSRLGANLALLSALDDAAEADYLLHALVNCDASSMPLDHHPLASAVVTRKVTDMLAWALNGAVPEVVRNQPISRSRRGPVAEGPTLGSPERQTAFQHLGITVERSRASNLLLHRQACYLGGMDSTRGSAEWLTQARRHRKYFGKAHGWSLAWPDARSVATSLANQGDNEPLRDFIANCHGDDSCELAGLNYWAYWIGEVESRQRDDLFMADRHLPWSGNRLFRHLVGRLDSDSAFVDLNIHSLWALLFLRRGLPHHDPASAGELMARAERILDIGTVSPQSHRELTSVTYGLRMDGFTMARSDV
ncbi:hypothetical protein Lfu02_55460 [Longispora fulva]|uniref:DNA-binding XRE family transcriptional regulator n=1 Tax=Longispora fulva TaxID=619741 RepID=A0A8J7GGG6_9ACTN|nr:helix-turn-helix transcriptional regulator [Longispora fulva]MBG6137471.1 DNA-binding XRE family transcriptional regulator [Longispora fulva]GIG61174.1 hypothetical protein Lfu02_55460 [Longispora fulva]